MMIARLGVGVQPTPKAAGWNNGVRALHACPFALSQLPAPQDHCQARQDCSYGPPEIRNACRAELLVGKPKRKRKLASERRMAWVSPLHNAERGRADGNPRGGRPLEKRAWRPAADHDFAGKRRDWAPSLPSNENPQCQQEAEDKEYRHGEAVSAEL